MEGLDACIVGRSRRRNTDANKLLHRILTFWLEAGLLHGCVPIDYCLLHPSKILPPDRPDMLDPEFDFARSAFAITVSRQQSGGFNKRYRELLGDCFGG